ncbi:MAG: DUF2975 domain-containing protein [Planctomycetes bacterium]|nr:DUF2975 domain-containing protein [Planctomycetota bacterium]
MLNLSSSTKPMPWRRTALIVLVSTLTLMTALALCAPLVNRWVSDAHANGARLSAPVAGFFAVVRFAHAPVMLGLLGLSWFLVTIGVLARLTASRAPLETNRRLERIRRHATRLRLILVLFTAPCAVIAIPLILTGRDTDEIIRGYEFSDQAPTFLGRANALAIIAVIMVMAWNAFKLLNLYASGTLFNHANARCLKSIGYIVVFLGSGLYPLLLNSFLGDCLAKPLNVMLDVPLMLSGSVIILLGWVTEEATLIHEERELTV